LADGTDYNESSLPSRPEFDAMPTFETSATVEGDGQVRVSGVPFPPGTTVEVTINPQPSLTAAPAAAWQGLCAALDKSRNIAPIGALRREELYDRDDLH
jgi:hypothetical protein